MPLANFHEVLDCLASFFQPSQAVDEAMDFLSLFMNVAGGLSVSSVVEMIACLVLTVRVVTIPIIMRCVTVPTRLAFAVSSFFARVYRGSTAVFAGACLFSIFTHALARTRVVYHSIIGKEGCLS